MQTTTTLTRILTAGAAALLFSLVPLRAQYTAPNIITTPGDTTVTVGGTTFINHGLQGVGRISGSALDAFGETFGSVSSMQITNWSGGNGSSYAGTFNILPDRGYNNNNAGGFFSDYAARIQQVDFSFTPYSGSTNIGGTDLTSKIAAQNQITLSPTITGVKFTYLDPAKGSTPQLTTGLDPGVAGQATLFGKVVPFVIDYTGQSFPGDTTNDTYTGINRLALDSEALVLKSDGSGYIGDEYGANVYYFNAAKQIVGVITPPEALRPHTGANFNFNSLAPAANGRRNNQGYEGVALSPDGTKLFALLQSATVQDTNGALQQTRSNTRLVVYNVGANATPDSPTAEYVIQLPTYTQNGAGGAVNATAAQSEIIALDDHRLLVLSRDANGQASVMTNPSAYKSVLLVDLSVGNPTNIAGTAYDAAGATITPGTAGVLDPLITPLTWGQAVNMLNSTQLSKFNIDLDQGGLSQVSKLTLGEKWEGMSLVSANDPAAPNDYFLFIANDNDFLTSQGKMIGPDGTIQNYNAFTNGYPAQRIPTAPDGAATTENDTMFLAYRVTIVPEPTTPLLALAAAAALITRRRRSALGV